MDVEKIQKINDLALKLQQQAGMSREEAAKQAEIMLSKDTNMEVSEITPQKLKEIETQEKSQPNITWQEAMKKNTDFVVKQFKDIQREIINIKAEMDTLKTHVKNMKTAPPPPPAKVETQKELNKEPEKHPKRGDVKENDVSIEKMFYFGSK